MSLPAALRHAPRHSVGAERVAPPNAAAATPSLNAGPAPKRGRDAKPGADDGHRNSGRTAKRPPPGVARGDLLRDLRRIWMGARFKRSPCAILAASIHATGDGHGRREDADAIFRVLRSTLSEFGAIYDVGPRMLVAVMPDVHLHQAQTMAGAMIAAVDARATRGGPAQTLAAGVAALHRDDDPATAVASAEHCLRAARESPHSRVVAETEPGMRAGRRD